VERYHRLEEEDHHDHHEEDHRVHAEDLQDLQDLWCCRGEASTDRMREGEAKMECGWVKKASAPGKSEG
jgi:hypothetical protein